MTSNKLTARSSLEPQLMIRDLIRDHRYHHRNCPTRTASVTVSNAELDEPRLPLDGAIAPN